MYEASWTKAREKSKLLLLLLLLLFISLFSFLVSVSGIESFSADESVEGRKVPAPRDNTSDCLFLMLGAEVDALGRGYEVAIFFSFMFIYLFIYFLFFFAGVWLEFESIESRLCFDHTENWKSNHRFVIYQE